MRPVIGLLCAAALSATAAAQSPSDPFEVCAQKADPTARLACFDQEMQRRHTNSSPRETSPPRDANSPPREINSPPREARPPPIKDEAKPIVARVVRSTSSPDHRYTLVLDNGQVWEQVDGRQGLYIVAQETVTISPAALGSFFLETSKRQYLRVRRLQ